MVLEQLNKRDLCKSGVQESEPLAMEQVKMMTSVKDQICVKTKGSDNPAQTTCGTEMTRENTTCRKGHMDKVVGNNPILTKRHKDDEETSSAPQQVEPL